MRSSSKRGLPELIFGKKMFKFKFKNLTQQQCDVVDLLSRLTYAQCSEAYVMSACMTRAG